MTSPASVGDGDRLRLFLALVLPPETISALADWAASELRGGRRVPREHLHVTVAFLGSRPAAETPAIVAALREAATHVEPFPLVVERWRETASVGMLVLDDPTGRAAIFADDIHGRLERLGVYRRESRPWLPHVTFLRHRARPRLDPTLPADRTFVPSDAAAFISHLHPTGARYEVLESTPLGGTRG